ncbi:phosphocarrier protein HPr [Thiohalocapsa halophila]|jgi:phosphocarrier protein|uniref:Phosphocarrier protein HPr n=1 Tax=Thiohalocapsa halophila TaxID=69359 RepID=A0ABS1CKP8_9GAMM|nr:HPr family phosphocarrier protein [Thiohalocapsa halophila]MBK1632414.1 phosphocarrier protein HPr [Thiohalocapsa halophila]NBC12929.1 HPr family phosphocarrier protein [Gammaproteobacteria bacterium]
MICKDLEIVNRLGLHARAAARFVKCAGAFESDIAVERNGRRVNGKSIMGIMTLAAACGTSIRLEVNGTDEAAAVEALTQLVAERFGEAE